MKNAVIIILAVLVLAMGGYLVYDKIIDKDDKIEDDNTIENNENGKQDSYTLINKNDEMIQLLYNGSKGLYSGVGDPIYITKYLTAEDRLYEDKLCLAINQIGDYDTVIFSELDVKQLYEKVNGIDSYVRLEKIDCPCTTFAFDNEKSGFYILEDGCGFDGSYKENINEVRKYSDRIEITTEYYYSGIDAKSGTFKACTDINCTAVLTEVEDYVEIDYFEQYKNQLNKLTYTYKLDENGSYYYYSTEINKK